MKLVEAEEVHGEMGDKGINPDEGTCGLLIDACFKDSRPDDAAGYFRKMVDSGLRPNLAVYNRLVDGLVKVGKIDDAKAFFDLMEKKLKMDVASYQFMMQVMSDAGRLDDLLQIVDKLLDDNGVDFDQEFQEFVKGLLRKEGREEDLTKLMEEKERQKAERKAKELEAAEAAKRTAREAIASLQISNLFARKDGEAPAEALTQRGGEAALDGGTGNESADSKSVEKANDAKKLDNAEARGDGLSEQATA